jgi:hypothetical protein
MEKKYIIELEDKPFHKEDGDFLCRVKGFNSLVFDQNGLDKLTPYTEPDLDAIRNEAWAAARKIAISEESGGLTCREMQRIFCTDETDEIFDMSASEAVEKIRQYEQEQEEEQIQVWDEVKAFERKPFIVTGFGYGDEDTVYCHGFVTENGISTIAKKDECVKTGRCFSEIAEVLRKMKEKS